MVDITTVQVSPNDSSTLIVTAGDISNITVSSQNKDTTILTQTSGTINIGSLNLSNSAPADIARTASAGVSDLASRADHIHSASGLLLDGGNY